MIWDDGLCSFMMGVALAMMGMYCIVDIGITLLRPENPLGVEFVVAAGHS